MNDPLIVRLPAELVAELNKLAEYYDLPSPTAVLQHGITLLQTFKKFGELNADVAVVEASGAIERVNIYPPAQLVR